MVVAGQEYKLKRDRFGDSLLLNHRWIGVRVVVVEVASPCILDDWANNSPVWMVRGPNPTSRNECMLYATEDMMEALEVPW